MPPITDALPDVRRELRFFPLDVYSAAEADANRTYFDGLMARATAAGWDAYAINGWQLRCEGMYDMIVEPRILDYVQDLLGENLVCWGAHFFCKMPGDERRVSFHQDASYWPLTPSKTVTVWLAIDDAPMETGPMTVVPRSHLRGQIAFEKSEAEEQNVLGQTVVDPQRYGDEPVPFVMKAGQISLHTDLLLHGSEPNRSDRRRCGLTMRFVPPDVRAHKGWNHNAIICRGSDPSGHWPQNRRPNGDDVPVKA